MDDDADAGSHRRLAGGYVLTDVRRRVRPRGGRVADCPVCGGYLREDEWHVAATVAHGSLAAPETATHHFCSDDCLEEWLGLYGGADATGRERGPGTGPVDPVG